jgi:hypothetical protein
MNDDILKELENLYTQLRNMQTDMIHLGLIIAGLLVAILALGGFALHHFW